MLALSVDDALSGEGQRYPVSHFHEVSWAVGPLGQSGWPQTIGQSGIVILNETLSFAKVACTRNIPTEPMIVRVRFDDRTVDRSLNNPNQVDRNSRPEKTVAKP